ncbi:MAG: ABC transporter substrate-binding protein, partial [Cytophagales bacterium]|nr:ABC transporter substrate-binding protein [Cytophagales bacterium]
FALDYYTGMRLAADSLSKVGINIRLIAYEADKDTNKLLELVNSEEIKRMNLIIGPVFSHTAPAINAFADCMSITAFIPVNNNFKTIEKAQNTFLQQSSSITIADQVTSYAISAFAPDSAIIITSRNPKDTMQAYLCKMYYESKGGKVIGYSRVDKGNFWALNKVLTDTKLNQSGVLFIFNSDQMVAANIINVLELYDKNIPVMTTSHWLDFQSSNFEQLQRRNFHFTFPEYVPYDSVSVKRFRSNYLKRINILPSPYAIQGYELLMLLGPKLILKNSNIKAELRKMGFYPGLVLPGFDYSNSNDNRFVPIYKFIDNRLQLVNR